MAKLTANELFIIYGYIRGKQKKELLAVSFFFWDFNTNGPVSIYLLFSDIK